MSAINAAMHNTIQMYIDVSSNQNLRMTSFAYDEFRSKNENHICDFGF